MILIVILIIILFLLAYYLSSQTTNNNITIQQYIRNVDPEVTTPFIICVLKYGLGNRINCLTSSIILSRYLKIPLYVVWTDIDMGSVQLSDIWAPPYPFTLLETIPPRVGSGILTYEYQYNLFNNAHIRRLLDRKDVFLSKGIVDLKNNKDTPITVLSTYWNFKHPSQSLSTYYEQRSELLNQTLIPVPLITERIQRYRALCGPNTFGAHIRLTDSCEIFWGSQDGCHHLLNKLKDRIQNILDEDPNRTVFLCTDDQKYVQDLITKYESRIIIPESSLDRFSVEGQQEAYAEILALSYCSPLLLTLHSTFSSAVANLTTTDDCWFYSPSDDYICK